MLKPTVRNVMTWWFAADTPIRQYKFAFSPNLQWACEQVSRDFVPPSGAVTVETYQRADKLAFAKAVKQLLEIEVELTSKV